MMSLIVGHSIQHNCGFSKEFSLTFVQFSPHAWDMKRRSRLWIVAEATKCYWSHFLVTGLMLYKIVKFSMIWKKNHPAAIARGGKAGETTAITEATKTSGFSATKYEITAPGTTQQNDVEERTCPTLLRRV
jgi:hypothetical protein